MGGLQGEVGVVKDVSDGGLFDEIFYFSYHRAFTEQFNSHEEHGDGVVGTLDASACVLSLLVTLLSRRATNAEARIDTIEGTRSDVAGDGLFSLASAGSASLLLYGGNTRSLLDTSVALGTAVAEGRPRSPDAVSRTFLGITSTRVFGSTLTRGTSVLSVVRSSRSPRGTSTASLGALTPSSPFVPGAIDGSIGTPDDVTRQGFRGISSTRPTTVDCLVSGSGTGRKSSTARLVASSEGSPGVPGTIDRTKLSVALQRL